VKIALFSESYKPYISGVSRSVELLKKGLEALGHEVFVFAPDYPIYKDDEKNIIRLPSVPSKYPGFRVALPRPNLMPKVHFDIVHSASPFLLGIWSMIYARRRGLPYVYTFHTLFTEYLHYVPLPRKISLKIISFLIKHFCNRCDAVIVPSEMAKEYLLGFGVTRAINVVPSGIDDELCLKASPAGIREKLKIPADAKVLVYVGRLSKEKNVPFLLRVFAAVLAARPGTYLLIVADGPVRRELESLSKDLGIDKKTVFAGQVPYPEVLNYYKAGDIFVFSSKTETQGLVAAEAKACGLPVVALNARGIKESVVDGQDGFLVEEDEKAFLEKVLLLLDSRDLREEMARKAAENSLRDFSLEIIAKKAEMVYNFLKR
jgi:glycosyltransferase involved in cell wall biosynthesis